MGKTSQHKYYPSELIIGIVDDTPLSILLHRLQAKPIALPLKSKGLLQEDVDIQPYILQLAIKCFEKVKEYLVSNHTIASQYLNMSHVENNSRSLSLIHI